MKTTYRESYGNINSIEIREVSVPTPKSDELLIKVKATSVNRTDEGILLGKPFIFRFFVGFPKPKYKATGCDFSGEVIAIGSSVDKFKVGDELFGFLDNGLGTHAEYVCISQKQPIFLKPTNITHVQAAASLEGAHYAINFLNKLDFNTESKVFVNGATGAIGNAMIQILLAKGAKVSFTYPTDCYDKIKHFPAEHKADYLKEDFTELNEEFDFICDAVGKSSFGKCKKLLKPKGIYISSELGPKGENIPLSILGLFQKNKKRVIFPIPESPKESIPFISSLLKREALVPLIDKTYPLSQIKEAFDHMLTGEKRGSVIIKMD